MKRLESGGDRSTRSPVGAAREEREREVREERREEEGKKADVEPV
jgi:hypothetical protein